MELVDVSKTFYPQSGQVAAVSGVSLSLAPGEIVAVRGPSGCGKTTLLLMAGGLMHPDAGTVKVAGDDPYALSSEQRAKFRADRIGFVFQQFHLVPYLTVRENILVPTIAAKSEGLADRADELLELFGLTSRRHHTPAELSSGERQRTALARAILHKPPLLLADEPTGNLDAENGAKVLGAIDAYAKEGNSVLLVTHDDRAAAIAGRTVLLESGRITPG